VNIESSAGGVFRLEMTVAELKLVNNSLNEVAHGVRIDDTEFDLRLGAPREAVVGLLDQINAALRAQS
jgi:hypothetical protein